MGVHRTDAGTSPDPGVTANRSWFDHWFLEFVCILYLGIESFSMRSPISGLGSGYFFTQVFDPEDFKVFLNIGAIEVDAVDLLDEPLE